MTIMPMSAALPLIKAAVYTALAPLVAADASGLPSVYWQEATLDRAPTFLVFQSQDNGGKAAPMLSRRGWSGLITVRAYAPIENDVDQLLPLVEAAMATLGQPTGFSITVLEASPLTIPASDSLYAGAIIFRLALYPA